MSEIYIKTNEDGWTYTVDCGKYHNAEATLDEVTAFLSHESFITNKEVTEDMIKTII